ncbi:MAG: 50S ribosomal protein L18 [Spirochaetaceae bacterium]|nr:MAG: 50S ribosomal protein L18 [Spirochaetaceae bacterium]
MKRLIEKTKRRNRRKKSIRGKISGTAERPRITVFRSNKHLYVQVINDAEGRTLLSVSSQSGDTKGLRPNVADAGKLGEVLGVRMKDAKITSAVFDRNGYLFHGVVKAVADGARKAGISF